MSFPPVSLRRIVGSAIFIFVSGGAVAADDPALVKFRTEIKPLLEKYCFECHGDGAEKGQVSFDSFTDVASLRDHKLWLRALRNVRSGIMPPAEADALPPAEAQKLMAWIKQEGLGLDPAKPDPGRVTVRRLNRVEYRNTVRDLMGIDFDTLKEFPSDDTGYGFDNIADVLTISPMLLEKYLDAAQTVVGKAVVIKPRIVVEEPILGREFATIKVDTTLPAPKTPPAGEVAAAPAAAPAEAPAITPPVAPVLPPAAANVANGDVPPGAVVAAGAPPGAAGRGALPGRGQFQRGQGGRRGGGPPPVTRPVPTVEGDTVVLSYYTPAVVAAKHTLAHAGKYQVLVDLLAQETYADDKFDLNKCQVILTLDGEPLIDAEFVREGYGRKFEYTFDRDLAAGGHELALEIKPLGPETPQYRNLRLRINAITLRGPLAPEFWAKTPGYDKYFPRDVPTAAKARSLYAREILEKFATRAFRHPVDTATLDRLVALAEKVSIQPTRTFEDGVAQAMVAVLASPTFIFREDQSEPLKKGQANPLVDEYSLASRLSYFFWSSMPDAELIKLAGAGQLRANLPAQMKRLLDSPRADELVRNFTGQWLQARDITTVQLTAMDIYLRDHPNPQYEEAKAAFARLNAKPRSALTAEESDQLNAARQLVNSFPRQFAPPGNGNGFGNPDPKPQMTDSLRKAMLQETEMTFADVLKEDRSLLELLESNYTFLNEELAKHYGIEGVTGSAMRKVTLPEGSPRGGVLTQGTVLAVTSNPTRTSPVKRGVFILGAILGTPPAPPPPDIPPLEDAASPEELRNLNLRDTLALHAKKPICASCHSRMDPLGLALENFNAMGMWRTTDMGQPVQPAGTLITGESFSDIRELKHILTTSRRRDFYYSVTEKMLTYALGRGLDYYDTLALDQIVAQLEASGGKPSVLVNGIVNSVPFQQRRPSNGATAEYSPAPSATERLVQVTP